jgi:predicted dehydrogenase
MTRLRVATIGAGYFAGFHHEARARIPAVELAAVCDAIKARAAAMASGHGIPGIYTDPARTLDQERPDRVDIITPPATHLALIRETVARRIPTICQKAVCRTLAAAAGVTLVVHETFRFQPWHRELGRRLTAAVLGEVYGIASRLRPGAGQGPRAYLDRQPYFQTTERFLILEPASGARALFDGNRLVDHVAANGRLTMGELWLEGAAAVIRLDGDGRLHQRAVGSNEEHEIVYAWENRGFAGDCVHALQAHVVAHLRDGTPLVNRARDYLVNLRIEAAIYASAAGGRRVRLA